MLNPNWPRWIMASVAVYFKTFTDGIALPLITDGVDERESETLHYNHAELRVTGPFILEPSRHYYILNVDINVLLTELMDRSKTNAYEIATWCGVLQNAMDGPIDVFRYGSEEGDDQEWIGCLVTRTGRYDANKVHHFGQVSRVDRIRQSQVDGRFKMELSE